jgi:hypothetical protein
MYMYQVSLIPSHKFATHILLGVIWTLLFMLFFTCVNNINETFEKWFIVV